MLGSVERTAASPASASTVPWATPSTSSTPGSARGRALPLRHHQAFGHLAFDLNADRQWLDVNAGGGREGRLFTAQIERLKVTYNFTARAFLRVIGEYLDVERDPLLYTVPVSADSGSFAGSALFAYQLNWQTVFFVGYADNRAQDLLGDLQPADRWCS